MGCWVCLGLWLVVLVRWLCYCLPARTRSRPVSGTRAPVWRRVWLVYRARSGRQCRWWSCVWWGAPLVWALSFLGGRARRLLPGRPSSMPRSCPPKGECRSLSGAWRAGRRRAGVPRPGAGWIVLSLLVGRLRAAMSIASHTRGRCRVWSPQWRTRPPSWYSSPATVARQIGPLPGFWYRWMPPTHFIAGLSAAGARARTRSGSRDSGPGGPGGGAGTSRRGRGLAGPERTGGCAPPRGPRARAPAAAGPQGRAGTRRVPSEAPGSVLMKRASLRRLVVAADTQPAGSW